MSKRNGKVCGGCHGPIHSGLCSTDFGPLYSGNEPTIAVYLPNHGTYRSTVETVERYRNYTKKDLARLIADKHHVDSEYATAAYWSRYYSAVLLVVYSGLVNPIN